jgi:hypothetical protein
MRVQIVDPTAQLLHEIEHLRQKDVAATLALVRQFGQTNEVDWPTVGKAAVAKWSLKGWARVKQMSEKAFKPTPAPTAGERTSTVTD